MCLVGSFLRRVLALLLLANCHCGKRRCNFKEILDSYRVVIFVELQSLNLTGSTHTSKDRDPCPHAKARRILVSIYGMTQQVRCHRSGEQRSDLEKPVESMEQLVVHNCSPDYLGRRTSCSTVKKIRGKKRKRNKVIQVIKGLITCWQKLQSVYKLSK